MRRQNHETNVLQQSIQPIAPTFGPDVAPQPDETGECEHDSVEAPRTAFRLMEAAKTCVDIAAESRHIRLWCCPRREAPEPEIAATFSRRRGADVPMRSD